MFGLGPATRIYLAVGPTDMRKGFEGLYGLVRDQLGLDPCTARSPTRKVGPSITSAIHSALANSVSKALVGPLPSAMNRADPALRSPAGGRRWRD